MLKSFKSIVLSIVLFMLAVVPVQAREVLGKQIPDEEDIYPIFETLSDTSFTIKDTIVVNGNTYVESREFATKAGYCFLETEAGVNMFPASLGNHRLGNTHFIMNSNACYYYQQEFYTSSFDGHLVPYYNGVFTAIKEAPVPIKRNNKWYLDAKTACRLINKDYNTLPTFNQDKTVTFPSNYNVLIKCVGYGKYAIVYGDYTDTVINEKYYF